MMMRTVRDGAAKRRLVIVQVVAIAVISTVGMLAPDGARAQPRVPDPKCEFRQPDPKNPDYTVSCQPTAPRAPYNGPTIGQFLRKIFPHKTPEEIARRKKNKETDKLGRKLNKSTDKYEEGLAAQEKGKRKSAIRKFRAALKFWPSNYDALLALARIYRADKRYDDEIAMWQTAIDDCSWCEGLPAALQNARWAKSSEEKSAKAEVKADLAWGFYHKGQYREAIYEFEQVLRLIPNWVWAWDMLANSYYHVIVAEAWEFSLADLDRMVQAARRAFTLEPDDDRLRHDLAVEIGLKAGRLAARARVPAYVRPGPGETRPDFVRLALDSLEERARFLADEPKAWVNVGSTADGFGLTDEAENAYLKAIEIGRKDKKKHMFRLEIFEYSNFMLGRIRDLTQAGEGDEARRVFERAVSVAPGEYLFYTRLADFYVKKHERDTAMEILARGMRFDSTEGSTTSYYARLSYEVSREDMAKGDIDAAIALGKRVAQESPTHFSTYKQLGRLYMAAGRDADAIVSLREGFSRDDTVHGSMDFGFFGGQAFSSLLTDRAQVMERSGKLEGAESLYQEAIGFHKDNYFARYARSELLAQMGRDVEATESRRNLDAMIDAKILEEAASAAEHGNAASSRDAENARDQASMVFDTPGRYVPIISWFDTYTDIWGGRGDHGYPVVADMEVRDSVKNDIEFARAQKRRNDLAEIRVAVEKKIGRLYQDRDRDARNKGEIEMEIFNAKQNLRNIYVTNAGLASKQRKILEFYAEVENIPLTESEELLDFGVDFSEQPAPTQDDPIPDQGRVQPPDPATIFTVIQTHEQSE